jgi:hypothetical protein
MYTDKYMYTCSSYLVSKKEKEQPPLHPSQLST